MQFHHPDERYYTDAALLMAKSGDYWTPRFYDGTLRPHKPLLTYWAIAGSFRLAGVSMLSARLPSLVAGSLLLVLTGALAWVATRRPETVLLSACLVASQYTFVLCSNRATPDIFLTVALTLGFAGLFRGLQRGGADVPAWLLLLAGAAIAVLAKGLLGLVFLVFGARLLHQTSQGHRPWRLLVLVAWFALVAGWFVFMVMEHDVHFITGFLYDQVIGRFLKDVWWHKPLTVIGYLLLTPALFLPWWPLLWRMENRSRLLALIRPPRERWVSATGLWMLVCAVVFGLGNKLTARYVFSSVPLLAVLLAAVLAKPGKPDDASLAGVRRRVPRGLAPARLLVLLSALLSLPATGGPAPTQALPAAALAITLALTLWLTRLAPPDQSAVVGWSTLVLALLPLTALVMHVPFNRGIEHRLPAVIVRIHQEDPSLQGPVVCSVHPAALSRARLAAGRALSVIPARDVGTNTIPAAVRVRLISELDKTTPACAEFVTRSTVRLPVGSSSEIRRAWRARGLPQWSWLPSLLREGTPMAAFRIETRVAAVGETE
jgi:4-amino-4-deoxy-L-arabinose transferase-like glycosyltransferase